MYIEPNTVIKILQSVPLDKTYTNTIIFNSTSEQQAYFSGKTKFTLSNQTYQRAQQNIMRVEIKAEELYDCNYLMFQNTSFGNKWFYAFIKEVEYINNSVSQITYELDVMQTWLFDYQLEQCFVEREHSATDVPFENTVPENLETGEYISDDFEGFGLEPDAIVVAATFTKEGDSYVDATGTAYGNVYSGLVLNWFAGPTKYDDCTEFINGAVEAAKDAGIVSIFQMSEKFIAPSNTPAVEYTQDILLNTDRLGINGYAPRNKKLLTYPYNFLYLTTAQGEYCVYRYEHFKTITQDKVTFIVKGTFSCDPSVVIVPLQYNLNSGYNYDEKIVLRNYPQCSYNTDTFAAWLAQKGLTTGMSNLVSMGGAGVALAGAVAASNPVGWAVAAGAAINLFGTVVSSLNQVYEKAIAPNQAGGNVGGYTMTAINKHDIFYSHKHIRDEYAKIIDEYFDMFGYATHRVKVPNRNVRPHWCYTKTAGCIIKGSIPADDEEKICNIYNNGITFWKNGDEIGNYDLDNRV